MEPFYFYIGSEIGGMFKGDKHVRKLQTIGQDCDWDEINQSKGIIIFAETNDDYQDQLSSYGSVPNGIRFAQQIRLQNYRNPILFVSNLTREVFYNDRPDRMIINAIGHDFIQMNQSKKYLLECLDNMKALDDLELYDVKNSCCRREDIIKELAHSLNRKSFVGHHQVFIDVLSKMALVYGEDAGDIILQFKKKFAQITAENSALAIHEVTSYGAHLSGIDTLINSKPSSTSVIRKKWKILWVDDDVVLGHPLVKELDLLGVEVKVVNSAVAALELLEEDSTGSNEISVLLADYRLVKMVNGVEIQQPIQGYKLIRTVAKSGKVIQLAALSALPRKFLFKTFKYFNVRTEIFHKSDYLDTEQTRKILCNELLEMGERNYQTIISLPGGKGWRHLLPVYMQYINSFEYSSLERDLCEHALAYVQYFEKHSRFPAFLKLNKATFKMSPDPSANIEKSIPIWLGRRLALWLGGMKNYNNEQIAQLLLENKSSDFAVVFSQTLAVRVKDFPLGLTLEERNFFHYYIGYPIYKEIELTNNLLDVLSRHFKKATAPGCIFFNKLAKNNFKLKFNYGNYEGEMFFGEDGTPQFRVFIEVRSLYHELIKANALSGDLLISFIRTVNGIVNQEIVKRNVPNSIRLLSQFFKSELRVFEPHVHINEETKTLIEEFYNTIVMNKRVTRKLSSDETELYAKVYLACYSEELQENNPMPSLKVIIENFSAQLSEDSRLESESKKLTSNNFTSQGKNRTDSLAGDDLYN